MSSNANVKCLVTSPGRSTRSREHGALRPYYRKSEIRLQSQICCNSNDLIYIITTSLDLEIRTKTPGEYQAACTRLPFNQVPYTLCTE